MSIKMLFLNKIIIFNQESENIRKTRNSTYFWPKTLKTLFKVFNIQFVITEARSSLWGIIELTICCSLEVSHVAWKTPWVLFLKFQASNHLNWICIHLIKPQCLFSCWWAFTITVINVITAQFHSSPVK